jgi:RHS repeat-associated protein
VPLAQFVTSSVTGIETPVWKPTDRYLPEEDPLQRVPQRTAEATVFYYHCDQIGTPLMMTDDVGDVVWEASYKAWGEARKVIERASKAAGITPRNPIRFQGQQVDEESGLHYNRHRYYDPSIGRFVSTDPIGLAGGLNLYQYAPNSTQWVDPLGLIKLGYDKSARTWSTPAGLNYGQGSAHGNRVKHVLDHESPNTNKPKHSVFCVCRHGSSLDVVDEAWKKRGSPTRSGPNDVYEVPMGRSIGTQGETTVRIVTKAGTNEVVTAYPVQ